MNRAEILAAAADCVTRDRAATHGQAEDNLGRIAALWSVDLGVPIGAADVARLMVLMKVARARGNPGHLDSWVDIAGYAAIGGEVAAPAARRERAPTTNPGRVPDGFEITPAGTIRSTVAVRADFYDQPVGPKNPHGPVEAPLPGASPDTDPAPIAPVEVPAIPDDFTPPAAPVGPVEDADGQQPQSEPRPSTPAGSTSAAGQRKWSRRRASADADETDWPALIARVTQGESAREVAQETGCNFNRLIGKMGALARAEQKSHSDPVAPAPVVPVEQPSVTAPAVGHSAMGPLKGEAPVTGAAPPDQPRGAARPLADLSALDPKRGWTLDDRRRALEMRGGGAYPSAIAEVLGRDLRQVQNFLNNVRLGRSSVMAGSPRTNQLVPVKARPENLIPTVNGHRAIDPIIRDQWDRDREDAGIAGFVRRELYDAEHGQ